MQWPPLPSSAFLTSTQHIENGVRLARDQNVDLSNDQPRLRLSSLSEPITKSLVDCACTTWGRALSVLSIQEVVLPEGAFKEKPLLNATQKLHTSIPKAHTAEDIEWSFQILHHYHLAGFSMTGGCSVRGLTGGRKGQQAQAPSTSSPSRSAFSLLHWRCAAQAADAL